MTSVQKALELVGESLRYSADETVEADKEGFRLGMHCVIDSVSYCLHKVFPDEYKKPSPPGSEALREAYRLIRQSAIDVEESDKEMFRKELYMLMKALTYATELHFPEVLEEREDPADWWKN